MKGRKPHPTVMKLIKGNPTKQRLPKDEPKPDSAIPDPPEVLNAEALAEWNRVAPQLLALDLIADIDRADLAAYCMCWARWVEAEARVAQMGMVVASPQHGLKLNPYLRAANEALLLMDRFSAKFGLSPQDRARVRGSAVRNTKAHDESKAEGFFAKAA